MLRILFLALLLVALLIAMAIRYLPWYVSVGLLVVFFLSAKYLFRWGIQRMFMIPFKMKGAALRRARVTVHSVEPASPPVRRVEPEVDEEEERLGELETIRTTDAEGDASEVLSPVRTGETEEEEAEDEEEDTPREWYRLEVTIRPEAHDRKFQHWEPGELLLVPHDMKVTLETLEGDGPVQVEEVRLFDRETGQWVADDPGKYVGEQRLALLFGVRPGTPRRCKFQYYFESFGEVVLPPATVQAVQG